MLSNCNPSHHTSNLFKPKDSIAMFDYGTTILFERTPQALKYPNALLLRLVVGFPGVDV